jgi:hypothetical protein
VRERIRYSPLPAWLRSGLESPLLGAEGSKPLSGHFGYWICQLGVWGSLWLAAGYVVLGDPVRPVDSIVLINQTLCCLFGLAFTHCFRALYHLRNWRELRWSALAPKVAVTCLIFGTVMAFVNNITAFYFAGVPWHASMVFSAPLIFGAIQNALTLVSWTALYLGYQAHRQLQEERIDRILLDAEIKEAQLQRLRNQINPHFLFNSLNTIRAVASISTELTRDAITRLAELMRASLESSEEKVVSFESELRIVEAYLSLEQLRHHGQLDVECSVDRDLLDVSVPPLICQTLVENALKHGAYTYNRPSTVRYALTAEENSVCFKVSNPGSLKEDATHRGTGLANARRRLEIIYGRKASLSLQMIDPEEVVAELRLPRVLAEF